MSCDTESYLMARVVNFRLPPPWLMKRGSIIHRPLWTILMMPCCWSTCMAAFMVYFETPASLASSAWVFWMVLS